MIPTAASPLCPTLARRQTGSGRPPNADLGHDQGPRGGANVLLVASQAPLRVPGSHFHLSSSVFFPSPPRALKPAPLPVPFHATAARIYPTGTFRPSRASLSSQALGAPPVATPPATIPGSGLPSCGPPPIMPHVITAELWALQGEQGGRRPVERPGRQTEAPVQEDVTRGEQRAWQREQQLRRPRAPSSERA